MNIEIVKLVIGASVPLLIAYFGWLVNKSLKSIDHNQWQSRKIIEIRIELYKDISPKLNSMYCYCMWVGDWKETSPEEMISMKRYTDKQVNVYRHLLSEQFYVSYNNFIHTVYKTYRAPGQDATIRTEIAGIDGDRKKHSSAKWQPKWTSMFELNDISPRDELFERYGELMGNFRTCIGLKGA